MGIWDYISSTANAVNQNAVIPTWNLCWKSYSYCQAAAAKITAVPNLSQQLQNPQVSQFATNFAKNAAFFACREGLSMVPGGRPIFDIISSSVPNQKQLQKRGEKELTTEKEIKELHDLIAEMRKEMANMKQVLNQNEFDGRDVEWESTIKEANKNQAETIRLLMTKSLISNPNKPPMNVIQDMMRKGFIRGCDYDDLNMPK